MRNPASNFRTSIVMGLLLLGVGSQLAPAQTSVPQQLNTLRTQVNQAGQPSNAQTQAKPPSSAAQPAVKPPAPATKNSAQAKTSTPSAPQAQTKTSAAPTPTNPSAAKAQSVKPGAVSTANSAQAKPGAQPPVKVVNVKPPGTELSPKAQPAAATKPVATTKPLAAAKTVAAPGAQPKATPAVAEVPAAPIAEHIARRDPFDPLVDKAKDSPSGGPQAPLPAGKPGLVVATLRIDGIVKGSSGMIAIVSNPQSRVYFLREGDHLYDGEVEHISMEGVAFHQTGKDAFGKAVEREVTKRLYPTPGEQQ